MYYRHSRSPRWNERTNADEMRTKYPEQMLESAIKGMLPKGPLGRKMAKKLHVL